MAYSDAPPQRRTVNYPWVALSACVTLILGWAANAALAFITDWSGTLAWLAVPVATVVLAVATAFGTAHWQLLEPHPASGGRGSAQGRSPARSHQLPFFMSALLTALAVGVVGLTLTLGVRFVTGWVTGDESGVDRLVAPRSTTDRGLTLKVEAVEQTRHFTRVTAVAVNRVGNPITLNLYQNAVLQARNGETLEADAFRSDWVENLSPGATQRGVIVFGGHLADQVAFAHLSFTRVFEDGFDGPKSIAVTELRLRPPDDRG
jgi:hypothetical protein